MSELGKDLRMAIRELAISASRPDLIWVDTDISGQQVEICVGYIAARLEELGYLKVVRCRECVHRRSRLEYYGHRYYWCDKLQGIPRRKSMQFCGRGKRKVCSAGERVVAKDATGEEGASGAR